MKRLFFIPVLMCIFMLNIASTCSDDDNNNATVADPTPFINAVMSGTWRVTNFVEDGTNHTSDFTGYNFTFAASNVLSATNGTNSYVGIWSVTTDDDSQSDLDFNIGFSTPATFENLSDDWDIVSRTNTQIILTDVSGGNGGTDFLTLEKN